MNNKKELNVIFVAGNGFDLACNHDTRYIDFINYIKLRNNIKIEYSKEDKHIESFIDRCSRNIKKIEEIETPQLKEIIENNCFIKYFIDTEFDIRVWSDFEEEINKIIQEIHRIFNNETNNVHIKKDLINRLSLVYDVDEYCIKVLKTFHLISNVEDGVYNNILYFSINEEYYDFVYKMKWKNLINYLNHELTNLKNVLSFYLNNIVPIIQDMYFDESVEYNLRNIIPDYILSFNYTNYCDEFYEKDALHLHGSLKSNDIVLGFGDDNNFEIEYAIFSKYFQRIQNKIDLLSKNDKRFNIYSKGYTKDGAFVPSLPIKNHIVFYGVSFDLTDKDYIKEIYEAKNNELITIYYVDDNIDFSRKLANLISIFTKEVINEDIRTGKLVFKPIK